MSTNRPEPRAPDELHTLVTAARRGDRAAFDELVRRTYVDAYTLAVRLTGNEEDARDVVQEAYLRAWKGIRRFRGDAAFTTWLYRITANAAYTLVERRRRYRTVHLDDVPEPADLRLDARPDDLAASTLGLGDLAAALDRLPASMRTTVILKDVYGLSHEAIAAETNISVAAAKVRLHRGRKRLRDILDETERGGGTRDLGGTARAV
ncbi:MAG: sigma-70 family RNA polymerase sigma factor [Acidimicrobiia bacterium]|nr:sigma-70 family RNA polymerase sigma factor [Acidimicrobiia bacterium]